MPNYNCVEPANDAGADQHALTANAADTITFPAVDSCFAIGFVLTDGSLVGGHVPTFWDAKDFGLELSLLAKAGRKGQIHNAQTHAMKQGLSKIIGEINVLRGDTKVSLCITLGDTQWNVLWNAVIGRIGYPPEIRYRKNAGPRYLIVDGPNSSVDVQNAGVPVVGAAEAFVRGGRARKYPFAV